MCECDAVSKFNVIYDKGDGTIGIYLGEHAVYEVAVKCAKKFTDQYVGKPYPNGKGMYPFTNPRVARVS